MKQTTGVLYVDSEQHNLNAFRAYFREFKEYNIHLFRTGIDAVFALHTEKIDIIIADQPRPEVTGFEFASAARFNDSPPIIIALTVHRDTQVLEMAFKLMIHQTHDPSMQLPAGTACIFIRPCFSIGAKGVQAAGVHANCRRTGE